MDGLYYVAFLVALVVLLRWSDANDRIPPGSATTGLFAMRDAAKGKAAKGRGRPGRGARVIRNP